MSFSPLFKIYTFYKVKIWSKNYMVSYNPFPDTSFTVKKTKMLISHIILTSILVLLTVIEVSGNGYYKIM